MQTKMGIHIFPLFPESYIQKKTFQGEHAKLYPE